MNTRKKVLLKAKYLNIRLLKQNFEVKVQVAASEPR